MGRDFYDAYPEARAIFDNPSADFDIRAVCFEAGLETLSQTRYTQPCMAAFAAAVTLLLKKSGFAPDFAAGLSLGEYSALYAAGALSLDALLSILALRGAAMERSAQGVPSRMSAVLGLEADKVFEAVRSVSGASPEAGVVSVTNINCPGQIVIGGTEDAVLAAEAQCLSLGAKRCLPLNTSGPFHTPLMENASRELSDALDKITLSPQLIPVVFNVTGATAADSDVRGLLCRQVKSPVLFERTIRTLAAMSVDTVVEIGPGRVLGGFVRKTAPEMRVLNIETTEDFEKTTEALRSFN
jgi:[acyl-carrier-protein] S-malonyltransferase